MPLSKNLPSHQQRIEALFEALSGESPDYDSAAAQFSPHARYWAHTPVSEVIVGADNIIADLQRQFSLAGDLQCEPPLALICGEQQAAFERIDYVTVRHTGTRAPVRICAIFEFDTEGRICEWREYWDRAHCHQTMGFGQAD